MTKISFRLILAAIAATAALTACTKEPTPPNFENDKVNPATEGSRVIAVSFAPQTKTTLDGFQPVFVNGDKILVANGQDEPDTCVVSVNGGKATITTKLTGPLNAVYPAKAAKMNETNKNQIDTVLVSTEQDGSFASANICMAKNISEDAKMATFENKTAVFRIIPVAGKSAQCVEIRAEGFSIANNIPTGSAITDFSTIHVAPITTDTVYVPILVPENLTVGKLTFSDGTNEKTVTTGDRVDEKIAAGTLYTVTNENWESTEDDTPDGALKGVFTVSLYKKVRFTKGNLYWNGSSYQFENNQYDYRHYNGKTGDAAVINGVATTTPSGTVGSFWWISSVEAVGKPYDETYTQTMPTSGTVYFFTEESNGIAAQSKANQNFAVNGERGKYHVLNASEWNYLLHLNNYSNGRPLDSNLFAKARVHNVNGLLIFPDDYILPSDYTKDGGGTGMAVINNKTAMFPEDSIPTDVWSSMESEGVVFLPAAGYRTSDQIGSVGDLGHYLTSFANNSGNTSKLFFSASQVNCDGTSSCASGNLIRLIYEETGN